LIGSPALTDRPQNSNFIGTISSRWAFFFEAIFMQDVNHLTPVSLSEALSLLSEYKDRARIMAGGTDVLVRMKRGLELPPVLIDIKNLSDLNYIELGPAGELQLGSNVSLLELEESPLVRNRFGVLSQAAGLMASPAVRRQATLGGNIGNAAPSADIVPALIVLGADVGIASLEGETTVKLEKLFRGPGETLLQPGQIITEIRVPAMPARAGAVYLKQKRRAGADLAVAGVAAFVTLSGGPESMVGTVLEEIILALAAVAPTPIRALKAELHLKGKEVTPEVLAEAGRIASGECRPIDDVRGSADYRRKLIAVLVPRAILGAIDQAKADTRK
jgi:aerobic carbon-monoxide dehydrogenase medium subunit